MIFGTPAPKAIEKNQHDKSDLSINKHVRAMFYDKRKDFYMGFRDLRYFIDLVESESYHATAQKNQVA
ncbi:hypothetical protein [Lactobacillus delbrueckii]|uniref:hypothetical protein n=1 Tax=Lactobacillus delbrueckii TaxID=1584 RepID=UPI003A8A0CBC